MEEINGFSTASLITRSTNDITQVQMAIAMGLQVIIKAPILAVWAILKILGKSWQWTAVTGGAVVVLIIIIGIVVLFAMPKFRMLQVLTDDLNRVTRENLNTSFCYKNNGDNDAGYEPYNERTFTCNILGWCLSYK